MVSKSVFKWQVFLLLAGISSVLGTRAMVQQQHCTSFEIGNSTVYVTDNLASDIADAWNRAKSYRIAVLSYSGRSTKDAVKYETIKARFFMNNYANPYNPHERIIDVEVYDLSKPANVSNNAGSFTQNDIRRAHAVLSDNATDELRGRLQRVLLSSRPIPSAPPMPAGGFKPVAQPAVPAYKPVPERPLTLKIGSGASVCLDDPEAFTQSTFKELIEEAWGHSRACYLARVRCGSSFDPHPLDAKSLETWLKQGKKTNVLTNEKMVEIEIYRIDRPSDRQLKSAYAQRDASETARFERLLHAGEQTSKPAPAPSYTVPQPAPVYQPAPMVREIHTYEPASRPVPQPIFVPVAQPASQEVHHYHHEIPAPLKEVHEWALPLEEHWRCDKEIRSLEGDHILVYHRPRTPQEIEYDRIASLIVAGVVVGAVLIAAVVVGIKEGRRSHG